MKKNILIYSIFILSVVCFISLRVYAGQQISSPDSLKTAGDETDLAADASKASVHGAPENIKVEIDSNTLPDSADAEKPSDEWHGSLAPKRDYTSSKLPRIVCWGDSLTESPDGKTGYPDYLSKLTDCEVINYGVSSESTSMIAMRQGGISLTVDATVIPAKSETIPIFIHTDDDSSVLLQYFGDKGVNPCKIGGIEGVVQRLNGSYYFTRLNEGEITPIEDGTPLFTFANSDSNPSDILIIFTGTNDHPDRETVYDIIKLQRQMIRSAHASKYIVVGLTYSEDPAELDYVNEILANEYEDNFLDIRTYMMSYGLVDANVTVTAKDEADLMDGKIPSSLRRDAIHGNKYFNELLAQQVYRKLQDLGYLPLDAKEDNQ